MGTSARSRHQAGETDITILPAEDDRIRVKVNGVDVFHPQTGEVRSDGPDGIACWFLDTDYNVLESTA